MAASPSPFLVVALDIVASLTGVRLPVPRPDGMLKPPPDPKLEAGTTSPPEPGLARSELVRGNAKLSRWGLSDVIDNAESELRRSRL